MIETTPEPTIHPFTTETLLSLHKALKEALTIDDAAPADNKPYWCRQTPDWREQADEIEAELEARSVAFEPICWRRSHTLN